MDMFQISNEALKRYRAPLKCLIEAANELDDEAVIESALVLIERFQTNKAKGVNHHFRVIDGGQKFEDQPPFAN